MPYDTKVHLFHDQTEETDGDRSAQREGWPAGDNPPKSRLSRIEERKAKTKQDEGEQTNDHEFVAE